MAEAGAMSRQIEAAPGVAAGAADLERPGRPEPLGRRHHQHQLRRRRRRPPVRGARSAATSRCTASSRTQRARREPRRPCRRRRAGVGTAEPGALVLDFIDGRTFAAGRRQRSGEPRPDRRPRPPLPPRDPEASARPGAAVLGLPRRPRLRPHARRAPPPDWRTFALPAPRALERGGRAGRARLRPQRPAGRQHPRRRQPALAGRLGICRLQLRRSSISAASPRTAEMPLADARGAARSLLRRAARRRAPPPLRGDDRRLAAARDDVEHGLGNPFRASTSTTPPTPPRTSPASKPPGRPSGRPRMTDLPASAKIVVVGGGIVGCSTAYHLGRCGSTRCCCWSAQALLRLDLACRGPGRPAPHQRQRHPAPRLLRRALRPAGGGDRARHRLEDERRPAPRLQRRALDRGASARRPPRAPSAWRCISCRRRRRRTSGR